MERISNKFPKILTVNLKLLAFVFFINYYYYYFRQGLIPKAGLKPAI